MTDRLMATDAIIEDIDQDPPEVDEQAEADKLERDLVTLQTRVKELQGEIEQASKRGDDETMSHLLISLGRANSALGHRGAKAQYIARNADRAARRRRASLTLEYAHSQAVNKASLQAEVDTEKDFTIASEALLISDQAVDLAFRTDTFMKMAQTRVSLIKGDKHRG